MTIDTDYKHNGLNKANCIEDILCLTVLIANKVLLPDSTILDANNYYCDKLAEDCDYCQFNKTCLACLINE